jgi:D-alanyl-D-alanine carboxypeptidase
MNAGLKSEKRNSRFADIRTNISSFNPSNAPGGFMGRRFLLLLGFVLLVTEAAVFGQSIDSQSIGNQSIDASALSSKLDSYLEPYVKANDFSGVVLVAQGDRILSVREYGMADRAHARPSQRTTTFRLASLSKTFTAAATVMLIERGSVHLQDPLSHFFPEFPNGDHITVEQLLSHESGVGQLDAPDLMRACAGSNEMVRRIAKAPPFFAPGKGDRYSNEGYVLLAAIIEQVSGMSYETFLHKNIFEPLKMKHTGVMCAEWPFSNHAVGYIAGLGTDVETLPFNEASWNGPGSLYSTVDDLYIWLKAVNADRLFKFSALKYPYGWGRRNYSGKPLVEQSGQLEGYTAHMALYAKEKIYLVFLNNIESGLFSRVPKDLEAVLFGGKPSSPPDAAQVPASKDSLAEVAGAYSTKEYHVPLKFEVKDSTLFLHWGEVPFLRPLIMTGKDQFFARAEYGTYEFIRDAGGKVAGVNAKWSGGGNLELKREP